MNSQKVKEIVQGVLENKKKEQKIVITSSKDALNTPHNGTSSKTSEFLNKLKDEKEMKRIIDKTSTMVKEAIGEHFE